MARPIPLGRTAIRGDDRCAAGVDVTTCGQKGLREVERIVTRDCDVTGPPAQRTGQEGRIRAWPDAVIVPQLGHTWRGSAQVTGVASSDAVAEMTLSGGHGKKLTHRRRSIPAAGRNEFRIGANGSPDP